VRCGSAKRISKVKVLGSCAVRMLNKQAKVRCFIPVWVYPSKDKMAWFGAVLSAMVGCKVKVFGLVRWWVLCASKGLVSCRVLSKGKGLSYNQRFGVLVVWAGAVRVYLTFKL
jgi:hypothetical protein